MENTSAVYGKVDIIPEGLKPPHWVQSPPIKKPVITEQVKEEQEQLLLNIITNLQSFGQSLNSPLLTEVWDHFRNKIDIAMDPASPSTVKTIEAFLPRSLVAIHFYPLLGSPNEVKLETVWKTVEYCYQFHHTWTWTITEMEKIHCLFGDIISPRVFGTKNHEFNFDVSKKPLGGWLLPNAFDFRVKFNWATQVLCVTFCYTSLRLDWAITS